jgi:uncharacterized membrane protein
MRCWLDRHRRHRAFLAIVLVGFAIWAIGFFLLGIWAIYRIASGWSRLSSGRAVA